MTIYQQILHLLDSKKVPYQLISHEPTTNCEASAKARGLPQEVGAKSLLFKTKKGFHQFTLPAHLQAQNLLIRKILGSNKLRFASPEELSEQANVVKGALPPFAGGVILPFDFYMDEKIKKNTIIAFNPGVLDKSLILKTNDYFPLVNPTFCAFS